MNRSRWILALGFFGVIFGGTLAFWLVEDGWSFLDALYMTVISVTTVGYGEVHQLSSAGRVVAMVVLCAGLGVFGLVIQQVTSYAVGGALGNAVERRRMARKVAGMSGHTVICGFGARGQALAAGMEPGGCVAIERDADSEASNRWKEQGGVVFTFDAQNEALLELAGVEKAAQVVVAAGADETNLEVARAVRHFLGRDSKTRVVVAIEEYASRDWFEDKLHRQGIEPIGLREQALLALARKLAMEQVGERGGPPDDPLRIAVQSSESMLSELLRVLIMVMQTGGSQKPEISVFGCGKEFVSLFEARFPEHGLCCRINWEEGELGSSGVASQRPDLALFAMESNLRSLELAERCLSRYPEMKSGQVVACLTGGSSLKDLAQGKEGKLNTEVSPCVVSVYDFLSRTEGIVSYAMDDEGRHLHEQYRANADFPVDEWSGLSEFHRNSNRLAALQRDVYQLVWEKWRGQTDETTLLEYLAESEHMRWMAFHVMNGYRYDEKGVSREQRLRMKVHPDLVAYHSLSEEGKEKDRENIRAALR